MAGPNVAIVHDHLVQDGGAERVLRVLMKLWPEAPVYTLLYDPAKMGPDFAGRDIRTSYLQKVLGAIKFYKALLPLIPGAFQRFDFSGYDLVISSSSGFAKNIRTGPKTLHICYCYTPPRYLWHDSDRYIRELPYPAPVKWLIKLVRPRLRRRDLASAKDVDAFIGISKVVADRIKQTYGHEAAVIYPPVATEQFKPSPKQGDYLLIATRLEPYKRVDLAIAACKQLNLPLKIMGNGTDRRRLERLAGLAVTKGTIEFLGRVPDKDRARLYAEAQAMLNPQEEDFGITCVEALASGTPVIAYRAGAAMEIITPDCGRFFTPQTTDALAKQLQQFDRSKFDAARLRRRAEDFSTKHFKAELKEFIQKQLSKA